MLAYTTDQLRGHKLAVLDYAEYLDAYIGVALSNVHNPDARMLGTRMATSYRFMASLAMDGKAGGGPWQSCQRTIMTSTDYFNSVDMDEQDELLVTLLVNVITAYSIYFLQFAPEGAMGYMDDSGEIVELTDRDYEASLGKIITALALADRHGVNPDIVKKVGLQNE